MAVVIVEEGREMNGVRTELEPVEGTPPRTHLPSRDDHRVCPHSLLRQFDFDIFSPMAD